MDHSKEYLRQNRLAHILCPGCGHGTIMGAFLRAADQLKLEKDKVVVVSGIGCSSRASGYMDFNTLHTTHGRAIAFATGVKVANPDLKVVVLTGDGDCAAIGGNHLIHAARRNIDITVIVFNNNIYGMTNGQYSPTTGRGRMASTAPYGMVENSFDLCKLAIGAGATYVARGTTYNVIPLIGLIKKAIEHRGFSLVDVVSQCPTYYGRRNKMGKPAKMLEWQKENSVSIKNAEKMTPEELEGKIIWGEFYHNPNVPEYTEEYAKVIVRAQGGMR